MCVIFFYSQLMMIIPLWFLTAGFFFSFTSSQVQYYDQTSCFTDMDLPGTRYTCDTTSRKPCKTFFVYRAGDNFSTLANISGLFRIDSQVLLSYNNNVSSASQILEPGHEVLVPITCSCAGEFSQANFTYTVSESSAVSDIACGIFQGLVKSITLAQENNLQESSIVPPGSKLVVPLKCTCPAANRNLSTYGYGVKYFITYPLITGDSTKKLSQKFNVSATDIWRANKMGGQNPTLFPYTTVLIPLRKEPFINFDIPSSDPPSSFLPTISVEKNTKALQLKRVYIAGSVIGCSLVLALMVACALYVRAVKKYKAEKSNRPSTRRLSSWSSPFSEPQARSSTNSCLSPDLLNGIKYSVSSYTVEELNKATLNFCSYNKIGENLYKGSIENTEVMVKKTRFEGTRQVIDVHAKINHVNIAKLIGVCYEERISSYLVFEYPCNGSLRDRLSESSSALHWHRRTQIAFDIATGLHYLHNSVIASHVRSGLSSKSTFLNANWRAKVTVFGTEKSTNSRVSSEGLAMEKVEIFAFGVVLLEIISGREDSDGGFSRESINFGGANEGGCFDQLRGFVDPCLKDDYPLAEALCLAVLAGSCVEEDPLRRPSMDDVLKVLARMV